MNIDQLTQKLADIDAATLQDFILDLYLHYPELSDRIQALVLCNDPAALAEALGKRIQSLHRGRRFIDYRASFDFSRELDALLADIESGLLTTSSKQAFDLVDKFLATADSVMNRVDDSGGSVGEVYRQAVLLWLTQDQLQQLAWRYESALCKALKSPEQEGKLNYAALCSGVALGSVAQALRDPALYERSILIHSPQPNNLQMKAICESYLRYEQPEAAMRYLNQAWESRFEHDRLQLLDKVYAQTGDRQQLKQIRYQLFQTQQSHASFKRYLEVLDEEEKADACDAAIAEAEQGGNLPQSAELLLNLGQTDRAQALVLSRHQELAASFYDNLLRLTKALEKAHCDLAATACYRALLLDILTQARSKAYGHGVRYFKKLEALAGRIEAFKPLPEHHAFVQQLQSAHGRKSSFWARLQP